MMFIAILAVLLSYVIGSVSFAVIFTKLFSKKDIREFGSKNAGATNAIRVGGKKAGALTFLCDLLKGTVAVLVGKQIFGLVYGATGLAWTAPTYGAYLCGAACIIGHVFPCFFGFRGGKGVATGVGVFLAICPLSGVAGLLAFLIIALLTRIVSISSMGGVVATVVVAMIRYDRSVLFWPQLILTVFMASVVIVKHSENIKRLLAGNEKKLTFGGKKNG